MTDSLDLNIALAPAIIQFIDDVPIQISSLRDTTYRNNFKIREKFKRASALTSGNVELGWTSIEYVSDLCIFDDEKFDDFFYSQKFKGIKFGIIFLK